MKKLNTTVMYIAGLFLIVATIMKVYQLVTEPVMSNGFWESWEFFLIQIPLELGLGIWLICGLFKKAAHMLATIAYGGFICVTLTKALLGFESCGCFGVVHVNPWITLLAIDVPIFLFLLFFRPAGCKLLPPPWPNPYHFFAIAIPTFIFLPAVELFVVFNKPPQKTDTYEVVNTTDWVKPKPKLVIEANDINVPVIIEDVNRVVIEPNVVIEIPEPVLDLPQWPMLEHIDIADELKQGIWVVLMYHYDCPDCAEAMPEYNQMYKSLMGNDDVMRFAFVYLPPFNPEQGLGPVPKDNVCTLGKIDSGKMFYVETPVVVVLMDGSVMGAWEGRAPNLEEIFETAFK